jgi:hypothetical protein
MLTYKKIGLVIGIIVYFIIVVLLGIYGESREDPKPAVIDCSPYRVAPKVDVKIVEKKVPVENPVNVRMQKLIRDIKEVMDNKRYPTLESTKVLTLIVEYELELLPQPPKSRNQ